MYQDILKASTTGLSVRAMILEEEEHLAEMERALEAHPLGEKFRQRALALESQICETWLTAVEKSI